MFVHAPALIINKKCLRESVPLRASPRDVRTVDFVLLWLSRVLAVPSFHNIIIHLFFLLFSDLRSSDTAMYTCKAISETGETSWKATLTTSSKPSSTYSLCCTIAGRCPWNRSETHKRFEERCFVLFRPIKKCSFNLLCVWDCYQNAGSQLCIRFFSVKQASHLAKRACLLVCLFLLLLLGGGGRGRRGD